ncbi:MAG: DUF87 domain-containing protein [Candidatus Diapherotrites archaeon]
MSPEESPKRMHRIKGHKDPYAEIMGLGKKEEMPLEEEEERSPHHDETNENPIEEEEDETDAYADLLVEHGTHEEGIHGEDALEEEEEESPSARTTMDTAPSAAREKIKEQLILKSRGHGIEDAQSLLKLELLEMEGKKSLFIGRKKNLLQKSGLKGGLYLGRVMDDERFKEHKLFLDSLNPHVVFVCGARGSGKSYVLGVIAEELALHNPDVGVVVVDPVGVFWSMRYPNKEEKEVKELPSFDLLPQGLENMRVFIPEGMKAETPRSTYDSLYSIPPSLLTGEDWCLTFGIERFSPTGLLLEKTLKKVEKGYHNAQGEIVKGKKGTYTLSDLTRCLETDVEINSKEKGYKTDSVRALISRFEAAKSWGIFSDKGTPLSEISKTGQLTVIDTSFLDDTVTALVIGILARRLLAARKIQTRKEAADEVKERSVESLLENEIPPTWLFIDEAHTLIPSGNISTPATSAIVEYVKQGRRPGCSLVFATQQPSAIDTRVLSQLDVIMSHKLIFDDDIKSVTKRTPTIIPMRYKHPHFLKTLPVGTALVGDRREETNRAFVLRVRPRMSQHEGRDAETGERKKQLSEKEVHSLAVELLLAKLQKEGMLEKETIENVVQTLNQKYHSQLLLSNILDSLEERGGKINPKDATLYWPVEEENISQIDSELPHNKKADTLTQLVEPDSTEEESRFEALPITPTKEQIVDILQKASKKSVLGIVGKPTEQLQEVHLTYVPVWKVQYRQYTGKTSYHVRECFIDGEKGEFLHYINKKIVPSRGLGAVSGLNGQDFDIMRRIVNKPNQSIPELVKKTGIDEKSLKRSLVKLVDRKLIHVKNETKTPIFVSSKEIDLPLTGGEKELGSLQPIKLVHVPAITRENVHITEAMIHAQLTQLWSNVVVTQATEIFRPIFQATLVNPKTNAFRTIKVDGFTGSIIDE